MRSAQYVPEFGLRWNTRRSAGEPSAAVPFGHAISDPSFSDPGPGPIKGPGVFVYKADDATAKKWTKHTIDDGGVATEDLICADLNGDGKLDIVAGGRATHNVKLYVQK